MNDNDLLEILAIVAEECGEVVQAIGKALRHGIMDVNPKTGETNREALLTELSDLSLTIEMLQIILGDNRESILIRKVIKRIKLRKYLHSVNLKDLLEEMQIEEN